jgi:hypothetical protein
LTSSPAHTSLLTLHCSQPFQIPSFLAFILSPALPAWPKPLTRRKRLRCAPARRRLVEFRFTDPLWGIPPGWFRDNSSVFCLPWLASLSRAASRGVLKRRRLSSGLRYPSSAICLQSSFLYTFSALSSTLFALRFYAPLRETS